MKAWILAATLISSSFAFAVTDDRPTPHGPHNVGGTVGFNTGGPTVSAFYEYSIDSSFGAGGYVREFMKETTHGRESDGLIIVGGNAAFHFFKKNWDLSFNPGFAIINIDSAARPLRDSATTVGPSLGIGILYQINSVWAVGFDNVRYWAWFNDDYTGELRDDMSIKLRATF